MAKIVAVTGCPTGIAYAIMPAGNVPPLGLALAAILFKSRFTSWPLPWAPSSPP